MKIFITNNVEKTRNNSFTPNTAFIVNRNYDFFINMLLRYVWYQQFYFIKPRWNCTFFSVISYIISKLRVNWRTIYGLEKCDDTESLRIAVENAKDFTWLLHFYLFYLWKCLGNLKAEVSMKSYCSAWWNEFVIEAQGPAACPPLLRRPRFTLYNYSNGRLPTAFRAGLIIPNRLLPLPLLLWYTLR